MFTTLFKKLRILEHSKLPLVVLLAISLPFAINVNKVYAVQKELTVNWQYNDWPTLSGFKFYHENEYLCQTGDPSARSITCPIEVTQENNSITITAYDSYGNESAHSAPINAVYITSSSVPPVADNADYSLDEDTSFSANLSATDPENDPLTYSIVDHPSTGTIELLNSTTGEFLYTPNTNSNGTDTFTFTASDANNTSGLAQVILNVLPVNDSPLAVADQVTINEDSSAFVPVLLNDADIDGDTLTLVSVSNGTRGIATIMNNTIHYNPLSNYNGNDSFSYVISDGEVTAEGEVSVNIQPVNDTPIAYGHTVTISEDSSLTEVLNGSDIENGPLTFSIVSGSAHGQVILLDAATGSYRYTPQANWFGNDGFTYRVSDGSLNSNTASVSITVNPVNDSPVAQNMTISVTSAEGELNTFIASDVEGNNLVFVISSQPTLGQLDLLNGATGTFRYTPNGEVSGTDYFTYLVNDGQSSSNTATVTLHVDIATSNEPPVADAGPDQTLSVGDIVTLSATNSFDFDDGIAQIYWEQIDGPVVTLSDPASYRPTFHTEGMDLSSTSLIFQLTVTDNKGLQSTDSSIVNIIWENQAPVADAGVHVNVFDGETVSLDATRSYDIDDGIASFVWEQTYGIPVTLSDRFSPEASFTAPESGLDGESLVFELTVADNGGLISKDSVIINVSLSNNPPFADAGLDQNVIEGDSVTLDATASFDSDDGIQLVHWTQTTGVPVTLSSPTGMLTSFTAPLIQTGSSELVFMITATDLGGLQHSDTVLITLTKISDSDNVIPEVIIGTNNLEASSRGRWIKTNVELPEGYGVEMINMNTVKLSQINGVDIEQPLSAKGPAEIGDENLNSVLDMTVTFDRNECLSWLNKGENLIKVSGKLFDGTVFEQSTIVPY